MAWYEKQKPTPFDNAPIEGLFFLDGDVLARILTQRLTVGQKLPLIAFPSGLEFQIWESSQADNPIVHLFGEMDLPYRQIRNEAYERAQDVAEALGYVAKKVSKNQLEVQGYEDDEHYLITYRTTEKYIEMENVEPLKTTREQRAKHPGHVLMNEEIKKRLPPLYSGENSGEHLNAKAVVKYFHPITNWTWYASEGSEVDEDGFMDTDKTKVDFLFFGAVDGFEVELGYFTLSELESIGKERGIPIERDLSYTPQTLQEILDYHRRQRRLPE